MRKAMTRGNYKRLQKLKHPGEKGKAASLRDPKTRGQYNKLLQRKKQIIEASDKLKKRPLTVKEYEKLSKINKKVLERVETQRERIAVSSLLHSHAEILGSMEFALGEKLAGVSNSKYAFPSEIKGRGPKLEAGLGGIYGEAMNSILKKHKRFKPGELESILKTMNKSLLEIKNHQRILWGHTCDINAG